MHHLARWALSFRSVTILALALCVLGNTVRGGDAKLAEKDKQRAKFFETHVRPLLSEKCQICHGDFLQESNLRLDSRAGLLAGGDSGEPAIVPGKPEESLLVEAIRRESLEMPPDEPLSQEEITILVRWIATGAFWPDHGGKPMRSAPRELFSEEDRSWWAIQPVTDPPIPEIASDDWVRNPIDNFIGRRLADEGLAPAPQADRRVLIRRLSFDLTGIPPTPEEVAAFVSDREPGAYERLVDRLLESPEYGQRWARHWLDLVRYADSDGYRADHYRPNAWRYRDYVIESFNEDKPYTRFVQEQIAGDELFPGDPEALIATGYLAQGIYEYNNRAVRDQWRVMLEDITDTTGDVFLGLGFQCAKCHDHKFDPILQRDYYRLRSFFEGIWLKNRIAASPAEKKTHEKKMAQWRAKTSDIQEKLEAIKKPYMEDAAFGAIEMFPEDIQAMMRTPSDEREPLADQLAKLAYRQVVFAQERISYSDEDEKKIAALEKKLEKFDALKRAPLPRCRAAVAIGPTAPPTTIPGRPDNVIKPGFLSILESDPAEISPPQGLENSTGRRAALALWLTNPDNPLTPRVMVNRMWQHHFGRGLAPNPSDFGRLGGPPSHPELLDWLTTQFLQNGWHLKPLHRLIVTSATYRQSSRHPQQAEFASIDYKNQWYWHAPTHRLDAGQIRDAILAVTGRLDKAAGGAGVSTDVPRRTIYTRVMRNTRDPLLAAFDLPTFFTSTAVRQTTTTAMQSLLLINSERMIKHAHNLSEHVIDVSKGSPHDRVETAWLLAYGRMPTDSEHQATSRFLVAQAERIAPSDDEAIAKNVQTARIPHHSGEAIVLDPAGPQRAMRVLRSERLPTGDFTVEAYFQLESVYESGDVRAIVSKWSGSSSDPGWLFGITGEGSRRMPQTLVMWMHGTKRSGEFGEAAIFSDQRVELDTPYYAGACVALAGENTGEVTFYLKNLSTGAESIQVAGVPHAISGGMNNELPLTIGARGLDGSSSFDGLVDDVRISRDALAQRELLFLAPETTVRTVAYWRFAAGGNLLQDSSPNNLDIDPGSFNKFTGDPRRAAFVDLCHALLNSNEFLYVE